MRKNINTLLYVLLAGYALLMVVDVAMPILTTPFPFLGGAVETAINATTEAAKALLVAIIIAVVKR